MIIRLDDVGTILPGFAESCIAPPSTGPKWHMLFPGNTTRFRADFPPEGITFDAAFFESVVSNWSKLGKPQLPVDYGHNDKGLAAGWISDMRTDTAGNLEVLIEWTDRARAAISARELQFLSPTFSMTSVSPLTGETQGPTLYGAGLLNTPFLQDLPHVEASGDNEMTVKTKLDAVAPPPAAPVDTKGDFVKKLAEMLGLDAEASEQHVLECIARHMESSKAACGAEAKAKDAEVVNAAQIRSAIELAAAPLRVQLAQSEAKAVEMSQKLAALEAEREAAGIAELVRVSLARGVANAKAQVDKAIALGRTLENARAIVEMIPGTVVTGEIGHGTVEEEDDAASATSKLAVIANEIHKTEGLPMADAHIRAMERNLHLTRKVSGK